MKNKLKYVAALFFIITLTFVLVPVEKSQKKVTKEETEERKDAKTKKQIFYVVTKEVKNWLLKSGNPFFQDSIIASAFNGNKPVISDLGMTSSGGDDDGLSTRNINYGENETLLLDLNFKNKDHNKHNHKSIVYASRILVYKTTDFEEYGCVLNVWDKCSSSTSCISVLRKFEFFGKLSNGNFFINYHPQKMTI